MPILVQWKWIERTKTFLVIFHFFDNYSNPNLRIRKKSGHWEILYPQKKAWMSWAPSHVELGLLGELLRYANIVDGLKEFEKRKLRNVLEGESFEDIDDIASKVPSTTRIFKSYNRKDPFFVVELCPEYIEYLRKILKLYMN